MADPDAVLCPHCTQPTVSFTRMVLSLSQLMDFVHPRVSDHQLRVAYIAVRIAERLGFCESRRLEMLHAGALHDIGLIRVEDRLRILAMSLQEDMSWHEKTGHLLLKDVDLLSNAAEFIRYHHVSFADAQASQAAIPFESHILAMADCFERRLARDRHVLEQVDEVREYFLGQAGKEFEPRCVSALAEAWGRESFWLDCAYGNIRGLLEDQMDWPALQLGQSQLEDVAKVFAMVVDARSQWTAAHTAGVAATADMLGEAMKLPPHERSMLRTAAYLHDLGKLVVPTEILDKAGPLTAQEQCIVRSHTYHTYRVLNSIGGMPQISQWAAFHHERLDGRGYPFGLGGDDLCLGARIMAVADVFTAITEDRPYRKGMPREQAMNVLQEQVRGGGLDGDIVAALRSRFEVINEIRMMQQQTYGVQQREVMRLSMHPQAAVA